MARAAAPSGDTGEVDAPGPTALGQLVLRRGLLSDEQLESALAEHLSSGRRLGEVLIDSGFLDERQLADLLEEQRAQTRPPLDELRTQLASLRAEACA